MCNLKYLSVSFLGLVAALSLAFSLPKPAPNHDKPIDHYSLDPLPEAWKKNKSLLKAIDVVITTSVKELEQSFECTNCPNAPYSVSLIIDSPIIVKQNYVDIGNKKNSGGFNYECVTFFRFKSSLAVYDINQRGIAKVVITNPEEDQYNVTKKFNVFYKTGIGKLSPEEYISKNAAEVNPDMEDLMKFAEKKIYSLRDEVHKLYNRH